MLVEFSLFIVSFLSFIFPSKVSERENLSNCFKFAVNRKSIGAFHMSKAIFVFLERFPIECSKTKTKTEPVAYH